MPFFHAFMFFSFPHVLGAAGVFPVSFFPRFWLLVSFFPWIGGHFCSARGLGGLSHVFGAAGAFFHSRFCDFVCFLPWLGRAIHVFGCLTDCWSHAQTIWGVFPCCELCSLISFRTVCFSPYCEPFLLLRLGLCNSFFPV